MACEACAQTAGEASAWCGEDDRAELAEVAGTLGLRMADARECARDLHRAAWCVADGIVAAAVDAMSPGDADELANAWAASMTPREFGELDGELQEAVRARRGRMGLPLECLPDCRWGSGPGVPLDLLRAWTAVEGLRRPAGAKDGGEGTGTRRNASEASSARTEAPAGMPCGEAGGEAGNG